jgi:hypothetical protein
VRRNRAFSFQGAIINDEGNVFLRFKWERTAAIMRRCGPIIENEETKHPFDLRFGNKSHSSMLFIPYNCPANSTSVSGQVTTG